MCIYLLLTTIIFIVKTNLLELEYHYISYFKVKWQCWKFRENRHVDPQSLIGEFFLSGFVIKKLKKPQWWVWLNSIPVDFLQDRSSALRKAERFLFQKRAQRTWKPSYTYHIDEYEIQFQRVISCLLTKFIYIQQSGLFIKDEKFINRFSSASFLANLSRRWVLSKRGKS